MSTESAAAKACDQALPEMIAPIAAASFFGDAAQRKHQKRYSGKQDRLWKKTNTGLLLKFE